MVSQFEQNRKSVFAKKLRGLMDAWEKSNGRKLTQGELAAAVPVARETLNGWLQGKTFPVESAVSALCAFFGVPPSFFDPEEGELIFTDEQRHKDFDQFCRRIADHVGLSENLLRFIKENPGLSDLVISASWVNPVVNPPDSNVPDSSSAFQFVSSSGVRIYLPEEVIFMLRCVQRDLVEYASFLIRKYSRTIIDAHKASAGKSLPPSVSFDLDLRGMASLSPDESSLISVLRLLDEKGKTELAKSAAHIAHKHRKE